MAKFIYQMQGILDLKQKLENQEKIAFGLASAQLRKEQDVLQQLMIQKAGYDRKARTLVEGTINLREIHTCRKAIETMKARIRGQMLNVHQAEKQLDAVRRRLNEVRIERKTYEKLRERAFEAFRADLDREEKKEVDELVSYTYCQKEK